MTPAEENRQLRRQIAELQRRLSMQPAITGRYSRRLQQGVVSLNATLNSASSVACTLQKLTYNSLSSPTAATWGAAPNTQTITVFETLMVANGYSGWTFPAGTLAEAKQDPQSGIWYFADFYACPTKPS
ncbi:MAG TPA: hypothetical protein VGG64_12635 [Pirellulales bacterium]|jgi:hypothetical protein